jgi:arsenate reductase (thioredoxin)
MTMITINSTMRKRVLSASTHNSARSQMAEGLMNALRGDRYESFSTGTEMSQVNPYATKSLSEIGMRKHITSMQ